jgi:ADP-ribose pyrophosphatase
MTDRTPSRDDIEIIERRTLFQGVFRIDRYRLRHRSFNGHWCPPITRELFERGHAAAVLIYDPRRDAVALVEQFRVGAMAAGRRPWVIEVVAGIIEGDEAAEDVVRREAVEEAGIEVRELEPVVEYLASPGGTSETCKLFCGRADLTGAGGVHGLPEEGEETRVLVVPAAEAFTLAKGNRVENATCVIALLWLELNRERLRRAWR